MSRHIPTCPVPYLKSHIIGMGMWRREPASFTLVLLRSAGFRHFIHTSKQQRTQSTVRPSGFMYVFKRHYSAALMCARPWDSGIFSSCMFNVRRHFLAIHEVGVEAQQLPERHLASNAK